MSKIDKREADPRKALAAVAATSGVPLADLSKVIGRAPGYIATFVRTGVPRALAVEDHLRLADYLGVDERALGIRSYWHAKQLERFASGEDGPMYKVIYMQRGREVGSENWNGKLSEAQAYAIDTVASGGYERVEIRDANGRLVAHAPRSVSVV